MYISFVHTDVCGSNIFKRLEKVLTWINIVEEIRKTKKLKCSLKQKNKTGITLRNYLFSLAFTFFLILH